MHIEDHRGTMVPDQGACNSLPNTGWKILCLFNNIFAFQAVLSRRSRIDTWTLNLGITLPKRKARPFGRIPFHIAAVAGFSYWSGRSVTIVTC